MVLRKRNCLLFALSLQALLICSCAAVAPTFVTSHGTHVTTNGIEEITPEYMELALDFYILWMPGLYEVHAEGIEQMLKHADIEWLPDLVEYNGKRFYGLQWQRWCIVYWPGAIHKSVLFHELHHMMDELIFKKSPDYNHENIRLWSTLLILNKEFKEFKEIEEAL